MPTDTSAEVGREPKPSWQDVPEALRAKIAAIVGGEIAQADIVWGGFGPSATFLLTRRDGVRFFCKGTHPGQTPEGHAALKQERENYQRFPEIGAFSPRYIDGADEGDWHVAILEPVTKAFAVPPWRDDTVDRTMALLAEFHAATPPRAQSVLQSVIETSGLFDGDGGWRTVTASDEAQAGFANLFLDPDAARRWLAQHVERFAEAEARAKTLGGPQDWLHVDVRSDNLIFADDGRLYLVDWPFLAFGPALLDVAFFLPSLAGEGGPSCADGLKRYEEARGIAFDAADITAAIAVTAGFFAARAGLPEVPVLPRLRWIQKLQLFPALDWLSDSLGVKRPPPPMPFAL